jgi:hypothetical protein
LLERLDWRPLFPGMNPIDRTHGLVGAEHGVRLGERLWLETKPFSAMSAMDRGSEGCEVAHALSPAIGVGFDRIGDYANQTDAAEVLVRLTSSRRHQSGR